MGARGGIESMMTDTINERPVKGRVKWFDPGKGFGFVVSNEGGADILLHANVLRNFGQSSVADGSDIDDNSSIPAVCASIASST